MKRTQTTTPKAWILGVGFSKSYFLYFRYISFHGLLNKRFHPYPFIAYLSLSLLESINLILQSLHFSYSSRNVLERFCELVLLLCPHENSRKIAGVISFHTSSSTANWKTSCLKEMLSGKVNCYLWEWKATWKKVSNKCHWHCLIKLSLYKHPHFI